MMSTNHTKHHVKRRLERARAKLGHCLLVADSMGLCEDLELGMVSAMSELMEAERLYLEWKADRP